MDAFEERRPVDAAREVAASIGGEPGSREVRGLLLYGRFKVQTDGRLVLEAAATEALPQDFDCSARVVGTIDIGAFEAQP